MESIKGPLRPAGAVVTVSATVLAASAAARVSVSDGPGWDHGGDDSLAT